jgi:hypothetical protein
VIDEQKNKNILIQDYDFKNEYFLEPDKKFQPFQSIFTADEYKNLIYIKFILNLSTIKISKLFWDDIINDTSLLKLYQTAQAYWGNSGYPGRNTGDSVENYPKWYIKNNLCIPTTKGICEKSKDVFLNTDDIKAIAGKYLSVFDGVELNQDWKSFFQFKTQLVLDDYLELLTNILSDKNDNDKIKDDNKKRVQLVFKALLDLSCYWGTDEIDKVSSWATSSYLTDEDDNIVLCNELKYYSDGDNSIFQNIHNFIALNEDNKSHQNVEILLASLGIEILRQSSFSIEIEGKRAESDLRYKLESIFPFLKKMDSKT